MEFVLFALYLLSERACKLDSKMTQRPRCDTCYFASISAERVFMPMVSCLLFIWREELILQFQPVFSKCWLKGRPKDLNKPEANIFFCCKSKILFPKVLHHIEIKWLLPYLFYIYCVTFWDLRLCSLCYHMPCQQAQHFDKEDDK